MDHNRSFGRSSKRYCGVDRTSSDAAVKNAKDPGVDALTSARARARGSIGPAGPLRVAVMMACHNRREQTLGCLRALRAAQAEVSQTFDIYLLDDGSYDGTAEAVANEFPHVQLLHGDGSLFWNRGMHRVFEAALGRGYDFYLGLNDDTLLYPDALRRLFACHEQVMRARGRSGIVVGTTRDATSGELTYGGQVRKKWWRPLTFQFVSPRDSPVECDTTTWNVVLIPDVVARCLGNLEPSFAHAMGDTDYGLRAGRAGISNWVMPGFAGTCSDNSVEGTFLDAGTPLRERLKNMARPKGLPPKSWLLFCFRHAGPLWILFWAWPYLRVVLESLFGRGGARTRLADRRK